LSRQRPDLFNSLPFPVRAQDRKRLIAYRSAQGDVGCIEALHLDHATGNLIWLVQRAVGGP
jgi:hypothetical protein